MVARITTFVTNLSRNKIQCCKLGENVAQSALGYYFLQHILVLLLVLPLKVQLVSQQFEFNPCDWPSGSMANKKNMADAEDEPEL